LFLCLNRNVGFQGCDIFLDARLHALQQSNPIPIAAVSVRWFRHRVLSCFVRTNSFFLVIRGKNARATDLHAGQECSRIVELRWLSFRPGIQLGDIDQDLPIGRELNMRAIHGSWCRPLKINSFAVVSAAVTRTFEFVFARLPIGRTAQVCASSIDHKQAVRGTIDPDAVFLLELRIHAQGKIRGKADLERSVWLEQGAREKEAEKRQEPRAQECSYSAPHQSSPPLIDGAIVRSDGRYTASGRGFRSADCRCADIGGGRPTASYLRNRGQCWFRRCRRRSRRSRSCRGSGGRRCCLGGCSRLAQQCRNFCVRESRQVAPFASCLFGGNRGFAPLLSCG